MKPEEIAKITELFMNGDLSKEAYANIMNSMAKANEANIEKSEWQEKHDELVDKNRKQAEETRKRMKAREKQYRFDYELNTNLDFLAKLKNKLGQRVYSDESLSMMSNYEAASLVSNIVDHMSYEELLEVDKKMAEKKMKEDIANNKKEVGSKTNDFNKGVDEFNEPKVDDSVEKAVGTKDTETEDYGKEPKTDDFSIDNIIKDNDDVEKNATDEASSEEKEENDKVDLKKQKETRVGSIKDALTGLKDKIKANKGKIAATVPAIAALVGVTAIFAGPLGLGVGGALLGEALAGAGAYTWYEVNKGRGK